MMSESVAGLRFPGDHRVLLSHMVLLGTALIVEEHLGPGAVACRWTSSADPTACMKVDSTSAEDIARIVHDHAAKHVGHTDGDNEWLLSQHRSVGSLFSARTKSPASTELWRDVLRQRAEVASTLRGLDSAMVVGLGERAWWHYESKKMRPDRGASPWEMRTRNKGKEFVTDSLIPVGAAVAQRSLQEVVDGLMGVSVHDEVGNNKPESRTATGFTSPGPVDNAQAWAALWGIAAMPVWPVGGGRSVSSAAIPMRGRSRGQLLMPMPTQWVTPARWKVALRSKALISAVVTEAVEEHSEAEAIASRKQLASWGFPTILRFPVQVSGSSSAPERRALRAVVVT